MFVPSPRRRTSPTTSRLPWRCGCRGRLSFSARPTPSRASTPSGRPPQTSPAQRYPPPLCHAPVPLRRTVSLSRRAALRPAALRCVPLYHCTASHCVTALHCVPLCCTVLHCEHSLFRITTDFTCAAA
eukprot:1184488-Prorocentrum_minimum.AAC.2